eukprot:792946-Amphidinium_carterae.1
MDRVVEGGRHGDVLAELHPDDACGAREHASGVEQNDKQWQHTVQTTITTVRFLFLSQCISSTSTDCTFDRMASHTAATVSQGTVHACDALAASAMLKLCHPESRPHTNNY